MRTPVKPVAHSGTVGLAHNRFPVCCSPNRCRWLVFCLICDKFLWIINNDSFEPGLNWWVGDGGGVCVCMTMHIKLICFYRSKFVSNSSMKLNHIVAMRLMPVESGAVRYIGHWFRSALKHMLSTDMIRRQFSHCICLVSPTLISQIAYRYLLVARVPVLVLLNDCDHPLTHRLRQSTQLWRFKWNGISDNLSRYDRSHGAIAIWIFNEDGFSKESNNFHSSENCKIHKTHLFHHRSRCHRRLKCSSTRKHLFKCKWKNQESSNPTITRMTFSYRDVCIEPKWQMCQR